MTKLKALTRKQLRAFIAILVAVCVVVPSLVFVGLRGKAEMDYTQNPRYEEQKGTNIEELVTEKRVKSINDDGSYTLELEAYQTAQTLSQPNLDIMMVLDVSRRMNEELYKRDYYNLLNKSTFSPIELSSVNHSDMYDNINPYFERNTEWAERDYNGKKYIKDPNAPETYVYLSQSFDKQTTFEGSTAHWKATVTYYVHYMFTDSQGNNYISEVVPISATTLIHHVSQTAAEAAALVEAFAAIKKTRVGNLKFTLVDENNTHGTILKGTSNNPYEVSQFFTRDNDEGLNSSLYALQEQGRQLYIRDNNGDLRELYIERLDTPYGSDALPSKIGDKTSYPYDYIYSVPSLNLEAHQGNAYYGAEQGVFQGFKAYKYVDGEWVLDFDKTLVSKKIYVERTAEEASASTRYTVTRLDAMKESVEQYLIMAYMSAYEHKGGSDIHVGVATYGGVGKIAEYDKVTNSLGMVTSVQKMTLGKFDMTSEKDVSRMIDIIYAFTADNDSDEANAHIDQAMAAARAEFERHSANDRDSKGRICSDPKRITVVFAGGAPTSQGDWWGRGSGTEGYDYSNTDRLRLLRDRNWGVLQNFYDYNQYGKAASNWEKKANVSMANNALANADYIKNELGSQVYSIGLFGYANQNQLHGDKFYYYSGNILDLWEDLPCSGKVGSYWGYTSSAYAQAEASQWLGNKDRYIDPIEAAATNRFMNYLSSNYTDADQIGLRRRRDWNPRGYLISSLTKDGFKITKNFSRSSSNYYTAIDISSESDEVGNALQTAFRDVAAKTQIPDAELHENAKFTDVVSNYFQIVGSGTDGEITIDDVSAKVINADGTEDTALTAQLDKRFENGDKRHIVVTGFDYALYNMNEDSAHYIDYAGRYGEVGADLGYNPKKLVVTLNIKPTDSFLGGNNVPTNLGSSGISDSGDRLEELFEVPHVDVELKDAVILKDQAVYSGQRYNIADFIDTEVVNGENNAFVDIRLVIKDENNNVINTLIVPAESSEGELQDYIDDTIAHANANHPIGYKTTHYKVDYEIYPDYDKGTIKQSGKIAKTNEPVTAFVWVPSLKEKDDYVEENDKVDLTVHKMEDFDNPDVHIAMEWKCLEDNTPSPIGDAPNVTYTLADITPGSSDSNPKPIDNSFLQYEITQDTDFQIRAVVKTEAASYPWIRDTGTGDEPEEGITELDEITKVLVNENEVSYYNKKNVNSSKVKTVPETTGKFTIHIQKPTYALEIVKQFTGSYAVEETVTFTIKPFDSDDPDDVITIPFTVNSAVNDFTNLVATKLAGSFEYGETYLITETHENDSLYNTSYNGKYYRADTEVSSVTDEDGDNNETFKFTVSEDSQANDNGKVVLTVTNAFDESQAPAVTGVSEDKNSSNLVLIILSGMVVISGGAGAAYVYRKKDDFGETE